MNYIKHWLMSVVALLFSMVTNAEVIHSENFGSGLTWTLSDDGELVISGTGSMPKYNTYSTMAPWYDYRKYIKTVRITNGVMNIGEGAFGCSMTQLTSVVVGDDVTTIGKDAFYYCVNLTSVTLGKKVNVIGERAFDNCKKIEAITIPETITEIGSCAFSYCEGLMDVHISSMEAWCKIAFVDNRSNPLVYAKNLYLNGDLVTDIIIPRGVSSIAPFAFYTGKNFTSVTIPEGVTSIGKYAFALNDGLESIQIPASVTSIGDGAFVKCSNLKSISVAEGNTKYDSRNNCNAIIFTAFDELIQGCSTTVIPKDIVYIGDGAFNCSNITELSIPYGVVEIGSSAFRGCENLETVTIPETVTFLGGTAFAECTKLASITSYATIPPTTDESRVFEDANTSTAILYVPMSSVSDYESSNVWNVFKNIVGIEDDDEDLEDIEISDNQEAFVQTQSKMYNSITYTRIFNNIQWQSLYVPFDIDYDNIKEGFDVAYINDVHQFDDDNNGTIDRTQVEAIKITSGVLDANYPYLIRAKEVGEKTITVGEAMLYATKENSIDCSSVFRNYTFTGSYRTLTAEDLPASEGYYALVGGEWKQFSETAKLGSFRVYLKIDSRTADVKAAASISLRVVGDESEKGSTSIENSESGTENHTVIYDMQGRRVENPIKGVYIVNGVKRVF